MEPMLLLKALILGIVEGLTEFFPISSTGHLIIAGDLLGFNGTRAKVFEIAIQLAAILAVVWEYRVKIVQVLVGLPADRGATALRPQSDGGFYPLRGAGAAIRQCHQSTPVQPHFGGHRFHRGRSAYPVGGAA